MQHTYMGDFLKTSEDESFLQVANVNQHLLTVSAVIDQSSIKPTLINFIDPQCPCNVLAKTHIDKTLNSAHHFNIINVTPTSHPNLTIPASPATAIYDQQGTLKYFGTYGFGAFCSQDDKGLLDRVINEINAFGDATILNILGEGCYCRWGNS